MVRFMSSKTLDHDEMREQIISAAREIFAHYGYRKTTMDDIAASIYKAKSSIYHYFSGKEDIFKAVIEREGAQISRDIAAAVQRAAAPEEKITAYVNAANKAIRETENYFRLLRDEWFEIFDFTEEVKRNNESRGIEILASIIREGNDIGDFTVEHPELCSRAIATALQGFWFPMGILRRGSVEEESLHEFLRILLNGLRKR